MVCKEKFQEPLPDDCPEPLGHLISACRAYDGFQRPSAGGKLAAGVTSCADLKLFMESAGVCGNESNLTGNTGRKASEINNSNAVVIFLFYSAGGQTAQRGGTDGGAIKLLSLWLSIDPPSCPSSSDRGVLFEQLCDFKSSCWGTHRG